MLNNTYKGILYNTGIQCYVIYVNNKILVYACRLDNTSRLYNTSIPVTQPHQSEFEPSAAQKSVLSHHEQNHVLEMICPTH